MTLNEESLTIAGMSLLLAIATGGFSVARVKLAHRKMRREYEARFVILRYMRDTPGVRHDVHEISYRLHMGKRRVKQTLDQLCDRELIGCGYDEDQDRDYYYVHPAVPTTYEENN